MPGILIADSEAPFVFQMVQFLTEKGYQLAGLADTADKAVDLSRRFRPDLILMDTQLAEGSDGLSAAITIRSEQNIPIVFVTSNADETSLKKAKKLRPEGYVLKPFNPPQLQAAIEMALTSEDDPSRSENEMPDLKKRKRPVRDDHRQDQLLTLTPAELKVCKLIKMGQRTQEIANRLNINCTTVHWHRKNIRKKLGLTGTKMGLMGKLMYIL